MSSVAVDAANAQVTTNGPTPVVDAKEAVVGGEDSLDSGALRTATTLRDSSAAPAAPKSGSGMATGPVDAAEQPVGRQVCDRAGSEV